jgi:hypothetical protein
MEVVLEYPYCLHVLYDHTTATIRWLLVIYDSRDWTESI